MSGIHIIALFIIVVLLIASYFIARVHLKESIVSEEDDIITTLFKRLSNHIRKLNVDFTVEWYLAFLAVSPILLGAIMYFAVGSGPMAVIVGCMGFFIPEAIVQMMKMNDDKKFEERYARSLEQLSSSLRAGLSIAQAVEDTANCKFLHETMRRKYAKMSSDLQMGLTVSEAFHRFAEGTNNEDANDIAIAIDIQDEVGGHEADVIKEIANNINDRMMLRREIKSLFSSTSSMVWIMDFICPLVIIGFTVMNPSLAGVYFSNPLYTGIFIVIIVMMAFGTFINHRTLSKTTKGA